MIFDKLSNAKKYYSLNKNFEKAFDYLEKGEFIEGKNIIEGKTIFANVQTLVTKPQSDKKWEAHRRYIDIQYVIRGEEKMGFGLLSDFNSNISYDKEKDLEFLEGDKFSFVNVKEGEFVIFWPDDVHAPMLSTKEDIEIKKVIVKVAID